MDEELYFLPYIFFSVVLAMQAIRCSKTVCRFVNRRFLSQGPKTTSPTTHNPATERKMTSLELQHLARKGKKLAMVTAYDYPMVSASWAVIGFLSNNRAKYLI